MKSKNIVFVIVSVTIALAFGTIIYLGNKTAPGSTSGEIKDGMRLGGHHEIKVGENKVEIGDKGKEVMEPKVTFSKGNSHLSLAYSPESSVTPQVGDNKITWSEDSSEIYFQSNGGNVPRYEFDILLKEKPTNNTFTYGLDTDNLEFVFNEKDNTYSAYRKGYQNEKGIYKKGELFRIERPKIVDAKGKETWGKLDINVSQGQLSITVDPDFLSSAAYPVTIDPTITLNDTNHVLITKVDRFRWKLAVEYEIRNDEGKLLGSDVAIMEAKEGETAEQFLGFFKNYLTQRGAVWLLAQGNHTLKEMAMDRVSSVNFMAKDNGDDVDDEHKTAREARKHILTTLPSEDLAKEGPTALISVTLTEADKLQKQEGNNETFAIQDEIPGAGTEILRPSGVGDSTALSRFGGTANWDAVDEAAADDGTTFVQNNGLDDLSRFDYYALQDTALTSETIDSLDVTFRGIVSDEEAIDGGGFAGGVRLSATNTMGTTGFEFAWTNHTSSAHARPGGGSWAVADLNSLQAAVRCDQHEVDGFASAIGLMTQVYVTVNYTASSPTPTPLLQFKGGTQFRGKVKIEP